MGELSGEEDESVSDVSRSTEAAEDERAGNERMGVDDVEVSGAEEEESLMTTLVGDNSQVFTVELEGMRFAEMV